MPAPTGHVEWHGSETTGHWRTRVTYADGTRRWERLDGLTKAEQPRAKKRALIVQVGARTRVPTPGPRARVEEPEGESVEEYGARWLDDRRGTGRRWASYALDGLVRRGHGAPTAWTSDAPPERRDGRALWAAWCLHRDRVIVRDASRAHAAGRSVRVLALVAPWSATHGTEYTVARARAAGLEVYERVFGEGYHDGAAEEIDALKTPCFQRYRNNRIPSD